MRDLVERACSFLFGGFFLGFARHEGSDYSTVD